MEWTEKQILDTLRMIEVSDYDEVRIETTDFKLHVRKSAAAPSLSSHTAAVPTNAPTPAAIATPSAPICASPAPALVPATPGSAEAPPEGIVVIRAPMIGTFYRASAPHAPPFTDVGARVHGGDTVCLIEVMKLFNTIKAGTAGKVVRILAQNAATVQKDEPLLWIDPTAR